MPQVRSLTKVMIFDAYNRRVNYREKNKKITKAGVRALV